MLTESMGKAACAGAVLAFALAFMLWVIVPTAIAADDHILDPALSLTGGTGATSLDPVPDVGPTHPKKSFNGPCGVATDGYGDVYVASASGESLQDGAIDIFGPGGEFITEVPNEHWPCAIAVASTGRIYVLQNSPGEVVQYEPSVYEPATGKIEYDSSPTLVASGVEGMGFDPSNDHLHLSYPNFESKFRFEELLPDGGIADAFTEDVFANTHALAVWGQNHDVYASGVPWEPYEPEEARAYVVDATSHAVKMVLPDDSDAPDLDFGFTFGRGAIAVDQSNGDVYVDALSLNHRVDQFNVEGDYLGKLELKEKGLKAASPFSAIAVDQGAHSPNQGYVYVTSGFNATNSHLYAFAPSDVKPPEVRGEHLEEAGEAEALLAAELNPHGAATSYRFEFGAGDCTSNPCQSAPLPEAEAGAGGAFRPVSVSLAGLTPGATYHFRLIATNHCNPVEPEEACVTEGVDRTFSTFSPVPTKACANASLRFGPSGELADCRAYELVSPPDTNGRIPTGAVLGTGTSTWPVLLASADGRDVVFGTEGGALPGSGGSGFYDTYRSRRSSSGWSTGLSGLTGAEAGEPYASGVSADHEYSLWQVPKQKGSLPADQYVRGPGGMVEALGLGSLGAGEAEGRWIAPGAAHIIFTASGHLEPGAPPAGTRAIYDRSPGGPTHVVSLLPGEVTPSAGMGAEYLGVAAQGSAVVFRLDGAIYLRLGNAETLKVTDDPASFGGIAADGSRVFYAKGGNLFAFQVSTQATIAIGGGGQSTLVNVSADGSHVYFVSTLALTGTEANAQGEKSLPGAENLYVWDGGSGAVRFIAIVEEKDVVGEKPPLLGSPSDLIGGLGLWASDAVAAEQNRFRGPANDPSRTSADGRVFVFESRAKLSPYDNEGHSEIYRYDASAVELSCVSCNPTGAAAASEARLESRYAPVLTSIPPVGAVSEITNVASGGDAIFFQSGDRLAPHDLDGNTDVYEWRAPGTTACAEAEGCIRLISGGHSSSNDYLYGASADGSSVFFLSSDTLVPGDLDSTPSIYAAAVGGGFPQPPAPAPECQGEACQPPAPVTGDLSPASSTFIGPGNPDLQARRCPRGRHRRTVKGGGGHCKTHRAKHRRAHPRSRAAR